MKPEDGAVEKADQGFEGAHRRVLSSLAVPRLQSAEERAMKITPTHILILGIILMLMALTVYLGIVGGGR